MKLKNISWNTGLFLASSLFSFILAEGICRIFFPIPHSAAIKYLRDGHLGWRLKPNQVYLNPQKETCTINNLGFRGNRNTEITKPPNSIRIVAMGGSSTFCHNTGDEKNWTSLLERKLRNKYGSQIEIINAGAPGFSIFESKINYFYQIRELNPDVVIVNHTWNDMKFFHSIERGEYPRRNIRWSLWGDIRDFSKNFQLAWRVRHFLSKNIWPQHRENVYGESSDKNILISLGGPAHQWEKKNYEDLAVLLQKDGVLPVFSSQAGLLSADNWKKPEIRAIVYTHYVNLSFQETLKQWFATSRIIKDVSQEYDILFVDVYRSVPHKRRFLLDHVHLTEPGNARVAEAFFKKMIRDPKVKALLSKVKEKR